MGKVEKRPYVDLGRLMLVEHKAGSTILARFAYTLGPAGHRLAVDELAGRRVEYAYDNLYRLVNETVKSSGVTTYTSAYTYDLVGNRVGISGTGTGSLSRAYEYNANDQMVLYRQGLQNREAKYVYDDNGYLRAVEGDFPAEYAEYTWDLAGRLVSATNVSGTFFYRYDDDGMRVESRVDLAQPTKYLVDKEQAYDQVLEEYAPGGALAATYVQGLDLLFQSRSGTQSYYHADGLGSVRAITDPSGTVTDRYDYDAFGRELNAAQPTDNPYRFTGEQYDANLKQTYLRARYYDAAAGRFTGMDSYEGEQDEPLTLHKFAYAGGDPANRIDPTGESFISVVSTSLIGIARGITSFLIAHRVIPIGLAFLGVAAW